MNRIIAVTAVAVSLATGSFMGGTWWALRSCAAHASAHAASVYNCPMHPDYRSEHPGNCISRLSPDGGQVTGWTPGA